MPWLLLPKMLVIIKANASEIKTLVIVSMKCVAIAKRMKVILQKSSVDPGPEAILCHVSTMLQLACTVEWDNATTQQTLGKKSLLH